MVHLPVIDLLFLRARSITDHRLTITWFNPTTKTGRFSARCRSKQRIRWFNGPYLSKKSGRCPNTTMIETFTIDLSQIMSIPEEINNIARIETQQAPATTNINDKLDRPLPLRTNKIDGRVKRPLPARAQFASSKSTETRQWTPAWKQPL